jgi:hypothetical protein
LHRGEITLRFASQLGLNNGFAFPSTDPLQSTTGANTMAKSQDAKKETKKKSEKNIKEKRAEKKAKQQARNA